MSADLPQPPFAEQQQSMPGSSRAMDPQPDYGETSYKGSGRLAGKKAIITGADSGIGRAVALAFAREGADVLVSYYNEHEDAKETQRLVEGAGRKCVLMPGDIKDPPPLPQHRREGDLGHVRPDRRAGEQCSPPGVLLVDR